MTQNKITTPAELRAVLLSSIEAVLDGKLTVQQANSVASLSTELHKSIKQQWDMQVYAAENIGIDQGRLIKLLEV